MSTKIEWTDLTTNPIRARYAPTKGDGHYCEKIAPECARCYASRMQPRFRMPQFQESRILGVRHYFDPKRYQKVFDRQKPAKVFWCDMSDMFGAWVPDAWIDECFAVMALTPRHIHQVLTKRPDRMRAYMTTAGVAARIAEAAQLICGFDGHSYDVTKSAYVKGKKLVLPSSDVFWQGSCNPPDQPYKERWILKQWPLKNVWLGTSAGTQKSADAWIHELLQTPAAVRFVSVEPLLGPVDLTELPSHYDGESRPLLRLNALRGGHRCGPGNFRDTPHLDWVIVGGESGQGARHTEIAHIRSVVRQCVDADVPVFVKQMGSKPEDIQARISYRDSPTKKPDGFYRYLNDSKGGDISEWSEDLQIRQFPRTAA